VLKVERDYRDREKHGIAPDTPDTERNLRRALLGASTKRPRSLTDLNLIVDALKEQKLSSEDALKLWKSSEKIPEKLGLAERREAVPGPEPTKPEDLEAALKASIEAKGGAPQKGRRVRGRKVKAPTVPEAPAPVAEQPSPYLSPLPATERIGDSLDKFPTYPEKPPTNVEEPSTKVEDRFRQVKGEVAKEPPLTTEKGLVGEAPPEKATVADVDPLADINYRGFEFDSPMDKALFFLGQQRKKVSLGQVLDEATNARIEKVKQSLRERGLTDEDIRTRKPFFKKTEAKPSAPPRPVNPLEALLEEDIPTQHTEGAQDILDVMNQVANESLNTSAGRLFGEDTATLKGGQYADEFRATSSPAHLAYYNMLRGRPADPRANIGMMVSEVQGRIQEMKNQGKQVNEQMAADMFASLLYQTSIHEVPGHGTKGAMAQHVQSREPVFDPEMTARLGEPAFKEQAVPPLEEGFHPVIEQQLLREETLQPGQFKAGLFSEGAAPRRLELYRKALAEADAMAKAGELAPSRHWRAGLVDESKPLKSSVKESKLQTQADLDAYTAAQEKIRALREEVDRRRIAAIERPNDPKLAAELKTLNKQIFDAQIEALALKAGLGARGEKAGMAPRPKVSPEERARIRQETRKQRQEIAQQETGSEVDPHQTSSGPAMRQAQKDFEAGREYVARMTDDGTVTYVNEDGLGIYHQKGKEPVTVKVKPGLWDETLVEVKRKALGEEPLRDEGEKASAAPRPPVKPLDLKKVKKRLSSMKKLTKGQKQTLMDVAKNDPGSFMDALRAADNPTTFEKAIEAWKMGLLSAPSTLLIQGADVVESFSRMGEASLAPIIDRVVGGQRTRFAGEARSEVKGYIKTKAAASAQLRADLLDIVKGAPETLDPDRPLEFQTGKIGGKAGRVVRTPARFMNAIAKYLRTVGYGAELQKRAFRLASSELKGKSPADIQQRADQIFAEAMDPQNENWLSMVKEAREGAKARVFEAEPGPFLDALLKMRGENPWMHLVLPFLHVPGNITKIIAQRSPLGYVKAAKSYMKYKKALAEKLPETTLAELKGKAVDDISRPMLGTIIMGTFGMLAAQGGMTGGGPVDKKQKNLKRGSGWQPYSFVLPGELFGEPGKKFYVPYNRVQPLGALLGFAADMAEAKDLKTGEDRFDKGLESMAQNLTSQTYLQGLADAMEFITNPKEMAGQYAASLAGSVVPNIIAKTAQTIDPTAREIRSFDRGAAGAAESAFRAIKARIPGVSMTVPAKMSATGEEIQRPGNALSRALLFTQPTLETDRSDVIEFLEGLDVAPGLPSKEVTVRGAKTPLKEEEWQEISKANAQALDYIEANYMRNPTFRRLPRIKQQQYINNIFAKVRNITRQQMMRGTDLGQRVRESIYASQSPSS
jgi:hypothetical protein